MQQPVQGVSSSIHASREGVLRGQWVLHRQDGAVNALREGTGRHTRKKERKKERMEPHNVIRSDGSGIQYSAVHLKHLYKKVVVQQGMLWVVVLAVPRQS
jgi:hypothetical protein